MNKKINIALDGHSSCGKSTIAKQLAQSLGYTYIDTGAMYRGVTLFSLRNHLWQDGKPQEELIAQRLNEVSLRFEQTTEGQHLILNGEDVENEIRGMEVSNHVSPIATLAAVRTHLVKQQQEMAAKKGVVMDGRDVGTVVMPNAELKIFVTARPEVRAKRRYQELQAKGDSVTYEEVLHNITERDRIDSSREISPLKKADDAVLLDNSDLTIDEQQAVVVGMVQRVLKALR